MDSSTILWIAMVILAAGGILNLLVGKHRTPAEGMQTVLHGLVPLIAATAYLTMAMGQGISILPTDALVHNMGMQANAGMQTSTTIQNAAAALPPGTHVTRVLYYVRYIDWSITTPLLLLSLALGGMHAGPKRAWLIAGVIIADLLMIVTAFEFSASERDWVKWTWFIVSCIDFLAVYYVLWGPQMKSARLERDDVTASYTRHATILSVLWFGYPIVLALAPDGLYAISDAAGVLLIAILDILSKVVYGYLNVTSDARITDRDLRETQVNTERTVTTAAYRA